MAAILKECVIAIDTVTLSKKKLALEMQPEIFKLEKKIVMKNIYLSKLWYTSLGWQKLIFG